MAEDAKAAEAPPAGDAPAAGGGKCNHTSNMFEIMNRRGGR